ncbi:hypothetical protein ACFYXS_06835 [Streptomyces sp. NPDC002574]|uniref:hypothetical protein n=1 Tax=Streptomyces sp. NPDC002574 TaxID=3364652 RepID=UPI0036B192F4
MVPTDIGAATPATVWPDEINFLVYPAGQLQLGRGEEVNLGVIHDSAKQSRRCPSRGWRGLAAVLGCRINRHPAR